jgi:hypothetical protein
MAKITSFAKTSAGRGAHRRNAHRATFANAAEFFNSLLGVETAQHWRSASLFATATHLRFPPNAYALVILRQERDSSRHLARPGAVFLYVSAVMLPAM